ncbi:MAG: SRPBCC domain-containing protein [Burkholderiaceae bacterium]
MRPSLPYACLVAAGLSIAAQASASTSVVDRSRTEADGTRTMELSIDVPARTSDVWAALITTEGWRSWAAPVAHVDFRLRGVIETSYDPAAVLGTPGNIRNEILAFVPERMFAIRNVQAPARTAFDVPTFQSLHTVVLLETLTPERTRVSVIQPGYRAGEPWDTVYRHFAGGNAWTLEQLKARFEQGPVDWKKLAEQAAAGK